MSNKEDYKAIYLRSTRMYYAPLFSLINFIDKSLNDGKKSKNLNKIKPINLQVSHAAVSLCTMHSHAIYKGSLRTLQPKGSTTLISFSDIG